MPLSIPEPPLSVPAIWVAAQEEDRMAIWVAVQSGSFYG